MLGSTTVSAGSTVWDGPPDGDFLSAANWTLGAPGSDDSAIFNNNFNDSAVFSGTATTQDLFLRNTAGSIIFDVHRDEVGNTYTMSRFTIVGAATGETNHMVVPSGNLETGIVLISNAPGADGNRVEVTGTNTYWNATEGAATTASIRVGSNGGSNSTLSISGRAHVESQTQTIIGLQGASDNWSQYNNA